MPTTGNPAEQIQDPFVPPPLQAPTGPSPESIEGAGQIDLGGDGGAGSNNVDFSFLENFQGPYGRSSSFNTTQSSGGLLPELRGDLGNTIGQLQGFTPQFSTALKRLLGYPDEIDANAAERLKQFRVRGDDVSDAFSQAANLRAGTGIMGGTEGQNLRSNLLSNLVKRVEAQRSSVLDSAQQQKIAAILGTPSAAGIPMSILPSLFGAGQFNQSTGQGGSEAYNEDTTAGLNALMGLLRSGTTGG